MGVPDSTFDIQRIAHNIPDPIIDRFLIGYGPGIDDVFFDMDQREYGLDDILYKYLKRKGFERIIFVSPHRQLYFMDEKSRASLYGGRKKRFSDGKKVDTLLPNRLNSGPLADLNLLNHSAQTSRIIQENGMGDVHALRLLDYALRDSSEGKVAVVFIQTETIFRHFEDQRSLSALIGDWFKLPSSNRNLVFLQFGVDAYSDLLEIATRIPVPEVRETILHRKQKSGNLIRIPPPEIDEINLILRQKAEVTRLDEFETLAHWMENEQLPLKTWLAKIDACKQINVTKAKSEGWFSAYPAHEEDINERIQKLIGLEPIKNRIQELTAWLLVKHQDENHDRPKGETPILHMIFEGNPGTGKTTVARLMGEVFHELGLLKRGHLVEVKASDLISDHVGGTGLKTNRVIDQAIDGVLFIDEAYMLTEENRGGYGQEAVDTLLTRMDDDRSRLVVIVAGYPQRMKKFRKSNPGLTRRFPVENILTFEDYSAKELLEILVKMLIDRNIPMDDNSINTIDPLVKEILRTKDDDFGNAGEMRNLAEAIDRRRALRIIQGSINRSDPITQQDIPEYYQSFLQPKEILLEAVMQEFDSLIGLTSVKTMIRRLIYQLQYDRIRSDDNDFPLQKSQISRHMVFSGNPGTGKTTVARMLGKIFKSLGLLNKGHCIEVTRADLVAGYVGQTAIKTMEIVEKALDGILFIDEAYSLDSGSENDFGKEVIDTLIKVMEKYQGRLIVIAAGYPERMQRFISSNPGMASRFPLAIEFPDYTIEELIALFHYLSDSENFIFNDDVDAAVKYLLELEKIRLGNHFGNGRIVVNLFNEMKGRLAERVMLSLAQRSEKKLNQLDQPINQFVVEDVPQTDLSGLSKHDFIQTIPISTRATTNKF